MSVTSQAAVKPKPPEATAKPAAAVAAAAPARLVVKFHKEEPKDESFAARSGEWVFFYPQGDFGASPIPAMVTMDSDIQRALSLEVHYVGNIVHMNASKHMHDRATPIDRERNGGWSWNRGIKPLPKPEVSNS